MKHMKRSIGYLMLCFLVLSACNRNKSASTQGRKAPSKAFQSRIIIQPLDKVDDAVITHIERQFKAIFGDAVRVTHAVALPNSCLNQSKTRYRADSILKFLLSRTKVHEYTLGITANDISTTKGNYAD
jgi:archaemetzincin